MTISHSNDCQVLYVGQNHDTYRGVNQALQTLGLSVMWVQDLDSAAMLARTTNMAVMLCDSAIQRSRNKLFLPGTIRPGVSCVEMNLPEPDPSGGLFERNIQRTTRLLKVMNNLPEVQRLAS